MAAERSRLRPRSHRIYCRRRGAPKEVPKTPTDRPRPRHPPRTDCRGARSRSHRCTQGPAGSLRGRQEKPVRRRSIAESMVARSWCSSTGARRHSTAPRLVRGVDFRSRCRVCKNHDDGGVAPRPCAEPGNGRFRSSPGVGDDHRGDGNEVVASDHSTCALHQDRQRVAQRQVGGNNGHRGRDRMQARLRGSLITDGQRRVGAILWRQRRRKRAAAEGRAHETGPLSTEAYHDAAPEHGRSTKAHRPSWHGGP